MRLRVLALVAVLGACSAAGSVAERAVCPLVDSWREGAGADIADAGTAAGSNLDSARSQVLEAIDGLEDKLDTMEDRIEAIPDLGGVAGLEQDLLDRVSAARSRLDRYRDQAEGAPSTDDLPNLGSFDLDLFDGLVSCS